MKRILSILFLSLALLSCNRDNIPDKEIVEISKSEAVESQHRDKESNLISFFTLVVLTTVSVYLVVENINLKKKYKYLNMHLRDFSNIKIDKKEISNLLVQDTNFLNMIKNKLSPILIEEISEALRNDLHNISIELKKNHINYKSSEPSKEATTNKYLKNLGDKSFNTVSNNSNGSYFTLQNIQNDEAEFSYNANDKEAISKQIFKEGFCEIIKGGYDGAQKVNQVKPGRVRFINNKWTVVSPIQIELS